MIGLQLIILFTHSSLARTGLNYYKKNYIDVLSNIVYKHTSYTSLYRRRTRATALTNDSCVSPARVCPSNTTLASHARTRTCGTMHYTHASLAVCATTLLSLTHLHHEPSSACAQFTHIYTVMCKRRLRGSKWRMRQRRLACRWVRSPIRLC